MAQISVELKSQNIAYQNGSRHDTVDYVLVNLIEENGENLIDERDIFERNLRMSGLQLQVLEETDKHRFVKIHAPISTLLQYCEIMKLKMPLKNKFATNENKLTEQFSRSKLYLFDIHSKEFLQPSIKYMIINFILENEKYSNDDDTIEEHKIGITKLILKGVYEAAYPLHDEVQRSNLKSEWACIRKCLTRQPIDEIKNYFGIKIALYFIWLEFYSAMLFPAAIIGIAYLMIGLMINSTDENIDNICNGDNSFLLCPQCDVECEFLPVKDYCMYAAITHLLDNEWSVVFATVMSVGCVVYLNLWNRYSAEIVHSWGVNDNQLLDYELPTMHDKNDRNWKKFPNLVFSFTVVLFWVFIVLGVLLGLMFYRISLSASEFLYGDTKAAIVAITGGFFDLFSIILLNEVYGRIAIWITSKEFPRTQKEYEESLMWKLYIFWFINYYSSFFYIAFLKGKLIGDPSHYIRIFGYRQEECGPGMCIADLFIQIAVVLVGDMTYNNIIEYLVPYIRKKCRTCQVNADIEIKDHEPWVKNYKLLYWDGTSISLEHLEMVLQYGMVILFIAAFPLAPLFAFINNIFEIRMDAKNLLLNFRRPVAQNVHNIGIWLTIMNLISELAVITNGCIIAFTSNFIPHLMYKMFGKDNEKNQTFLDSTLSRFKINDFDTMSRYKIHMNFTECKYPDYRNPPEHEKKYEMTELYWHILAAKLLFVLLFQNGVSVLKLFINWLIPEIPAKLKSRIMHESKETQRFIIREENIIRRRSMNEI